MIIVIDGPAGSGKSSTAMAVAEKLGIEYIDSGALYRAVTLLYIAAGDEDAFFERMERSSISFEYRKQKFRVAIDGSDVTSKLRNPEVTEYVSHVAAMPRVRSFVNALMNRAATQGRYIAEGRDLGTVVFPEADVKFFMLADVEERVLRRYLELQESEETVSIEQVRDNILGRDRKDSSRESDPLKKAPDAVVIDTSDLKFDEQVQQICSIIKKRTNIQLKQ